MIEGIEVLNKVPIMKPTPVADFVTITSAIIIVFAVVIIICGAAFYNNWIIGFGVCLILCSIIAIAIYGRKEMETGRYEYQCTISNDVLFMDMYEKYEVASKDGELWTIRDKEVEDE